MNIVVKSLILILLVGLLYATVGAQIRPCPLRVDQFPEVRGFRLGMKVTQIRQRFRNFEPPERNEFGYSEFSYDFTLERGAFERFGDETKEPLEGIDTKGLGFVGLGFLDDQLVALAVTYDRSVKWRGLDEFLGLLINSLNLPARTEWREVDTETAEFRCDDYLIRATLRPKHGGSGIAFYKLGIEEEIEKRKAEKEERRRKEFKP